MTKKLATQKARSATRRGYHNINAGESWQRCPDCREQVTALHAPQASNNQRIKAVESELVEHLLHECGEHAISG